MINESVLINAALKAKSLSVDGVIRYELKLEPEGVRLGVKTKMQEVSYLLAYQEIAEAKFDILGFALDKVQSTLRHGKV